MKNEQQAAIWGLPMGFQAKKCAGEGALGG
jgi:hypothetical protein